MTSDLKTKAQKGLFWGLFNSSFRQFLGFAFGIFLSRQLLPEDYGLVALLTIFSSIGSIFTEGGLSSALINRKDINKKEYDAVFTFNVLVGAVIYIILFLCSPLIARYFHTPELESVSKIVFLGIVISSVGLVPSVYYAKSLQIKTKSIIATSAVFIGGLIGIIMAIYGFGYWSLVVQGLSTAIISSGGLYLCLPWRLKLCFDFSIIKEIFPFSIRLIITSLFDIFKGNIISIILGRLYTRNDVGYYNQANKWSNTAQSIITGMENSITQPVLSEVADDKSRQKRVLSKIVKFTSLFCFPLLFGLSMVSSEFIELLITDKWARSADLLRILCIGAAFTPIADVLSKSVLSRNNSSFFMWNVIISSILQVILMLLCHSDGIFTMIVVFTAFNIIWTLTWLIFTKKNIGYGIKDFLTDIGPYITISAVVMVLSWFTTFGIQSLMFKLISRIILSAILYIGVLLLLRSAILLQSIDFLFVKLGIKR